MNNRMLNEKLDDALAAIRNEKLDDAVVKAAAERVQAHIANQQAAAEAGVATVEHICGCDDFQTLIPAYLGGHLSSARTLLLEDHTRECLPCRKALKEARNGRKAGVQPARKPAARLSGYQATALHWALAAAVVIGFGVFAWPLASRFFNSVGTLHALVEAANGNVYRVAESSTQALKAGERLSKGERLRTAKDAGAVVKLGDGSTIETRERSEFSVNQTADGITINLERGNIIVQAAKQGGQRLYVATPDSLVSVTGTIFSVNAGTKGSRVSVVEGEVRVDRTGQKRVLRPGEQTVTHASIAPVPVQDEVAWSRDAGRYKQILATVKREIDAQVVMPGNRYSTRLLDLMPENTVLYAAIPNLTETLLRANSILQQSIQTNPELRQWWEAQKSGDGDSEIGTFLKHIAAFGQHLGPEIALGADRELIALAEVTNPTGLRAQLEQQLAAFAADPKREWQAQLVDDPLALAAPRKSKQNDEQPDQLLIWLRDDLAAVSTEPASLQQLALALKQGGANRFAATAFHARLADVYREGAGFLIGADLERFIGRLLAEEKPRENDLAALDQLGVTKLKHFIAEMKEVNGQPQNRAVVTFDPNQQHGLASWLSTPGPMGALQFISPDANVVGAFVVQNPAALYDDLLNTLRTAEPRAWQHLNELQTQHGISLREDFAAKLGGEFAAAVDGPVLPTPAWKVVIEVNTPAALQQSVERAVTALNTELAQRGEAQLVWDNAQVGGRTYYRLKPATGAGEVNYAFAYGYLVAAPNRALVENAIRYRESGHTLLQSSKFKAALPSDKQANFSALFYYNVASIVGPLANKMGAVKDGHEGKQILKQLGSDKATLGYVYSFGDRMVLSLNTEDGPVGLTPSSLLGLGGFGPFQIAKELTR